MLSCFVQKFDACVALHPYIPGKYGPATVLECREGESWYAVRFYDKTETNVPRDEVSSKYNLDFIPLFTIPHTRVCQPSRFSIKNVAYFHLIFYRNTEFPHL